MNVKNVIWDLRVGYNMPAAECNDSQLDDRLKEVLGDAQEETPANNIKCQVRPGESFITGCRSQSWFFKDRADAIIKSATVSKILSKSGKVLASDEASLVEQMADVFAYVVVEARCSACKGDLDEVEEGKFKIPADELADIRELGERCICWK